MNALSEISVDEKSFAFRDLQSIDKWESFTVSASLTLVGDLTATGRHRDVGRQRFFQVSLVSSTSIETTAGTSYLSLPGTAKGIGGVATMTNGTTNISVGDCHIDVATSRVYLPTQGPSGNTFNVCGWFEV